MSFKRDVFTRVERVSVRLAPYLEEAWRDVTAKLDGLNSSLASLAVPEERRATVSDLSLRAKGELAGQNAAEHQDD
ncbi:hypothetical protein [Marinobacter sp.]|uniref:hypothetical protein n=1 Tax=Marinobacter sp. TaxID=50741 RepID=UPI0035676F4B